MKDRAQTHSGSVIAASTPVSAYKPCLVDRMPIIKNKQQILEKIQGERIFYTFG